MQHSINEIVEMYIKKNLRNESFDKQYIKHSRNISFNLPEILDPEKQNQKRNTIKLQQKFCRNEIKYKSVTNWFSHKKSIESRLFSNKNQRQPIQKYKSQHTIQRHKRKLQAYSQITKNKFKESLQYTIELPDNNKQTIINSPTFKHTSIYPKKTSKTFYKTLNLRNKHLVKVHNNVISLNDKEMTNTRLNMWNTNSFYQTFC